MTYLILIKSVDKMGYNVELSQDLQKELQSREQNRTGEYIYFFRYYELDHHLILTEQQNGSEDRVHTEIKGIAHTPEEALERLERMAQTYASKLRNRIQDITDILPEIERRKR
ncbi:MAG: hypothetical protein AABX04_00225 [Nanoarchaeota archaeon]